MKLECIELTKLKPLERNVRKHSDKQIEELIKSVNQFGQTRAIVIDEDNNILIGNGLYLAMQKMGIDKAECFRKTGLNEVQKKKLVLSDNKIYSLGSDDYEEINKYINDIVSVSGDYEIAGYDKYILEQMTATDSEQNKMIESYGVITDTRLQENVNSVDTKKEVANDSPKSVTMVTETQISSQPKEKRFVVCPSCGEVIYLD